MKKILSIFLTILLVINILLFSFGKITPFYFWTTIIICAIAAYVVLPKMK
ncbi:hypothetical protein HZA97_10075 [Candidatus Woesearchaeota archaeon]|nr:hypothetical protein [Candidatus Woesearchaeota archaeon]